MAEQVICQEHGPSEGCVICQHLISEKKLGFARVLVAPEDDDYETAMCEACETLLLKEQEWSDALYEFAVWKLYCRHCYERVLQEHTPVAEGRMQDDGKAR